MYCCVCGLNVRGISYPETFDLDEEEIAQLYDKEQLPESQLEVRYTDQKKFEAKLTNFQWLKSGFARINASSFK